MFLPISLLWIHIILVLLSYNLGKLASKFVEPVLIDNLMKEIHNRKTPTLFVLTIALVTILGVIILNSYYLPLPETLRILIKEIKGTLPIRIIYFLTHSISITAVPILKKFILNPSYNHKTILVLFTIVTLLGIIHFFTFLLVLLFLSFTY